MTTSAFAVDIIAPIAVPIGTDVGISQARTSWLIGAYLFGYGMSQIPLGLLSDRYGRMPVIQASMGLYTLAGVLMTISTNGDNILLLRLLQGIGGACGPLLARAVARDIWSDKELQHVLSLMGWSLSVVTLCTPLIGSLVVSYLHWRGVTILMTLLGVSLMILMHKYGFETLSNKKKENILKQTIDSVRLFFDTPQSVWALVVGSMGFAGFQIILSSWGQVMNTYGIEASDTGYLLSLSVILYVGVAYLNSYLTHTLSSFTLLKISSYIFALGGSGFFLTTILEHSFILVWLSLSVYISSMGILIANVSTIALQPLGRAAGFAASILGTGMILFSTLYIYLHSLFSDHSVYSTALFLLLAGIGSLITYYIRRGIHVKTSD